MESNEKFATYKEFGKMLREVADLCAKLGDTPLYDSAPDLKEKVFYVVNRGAYDAYIEPWMRDFAEHPFDVTAAKKWAKEVEERKGK
jgi:hypothetical protein